MHKSLRLASLLVLLTASPVFAAEGGEGDLMDINTGLMIWTLLIFLIVLALLIKFAFPHILGAVEAREERIREQIEAAERDRAEASRLMEENRRALEETRAQVQEVLADARASAERVREDMLAQARSEQAAILERARAEIEREREEALQAMRRETVDLAIAAAERLVRQRFDAEENRRLVRDYLGQIASPEPAGV